MHACMYVRIQVSHQIFITDCQEGRGQHDHRGGLRPAEPPLSADLPPRAYAGTGPTGMLGATGPKENSQRHVLVFFSGGLTWFLMVYDSLYIVRFPSSKSGTKDPQTCGAYFLWVKSWMCFFFGCGRFLGADVCFFLNTYIILRKEHHKGREFLW